MPRVRSITAIEAAKYSQLPERRTNRNSSSGGRAVSRRSARV
jgi:hypothetical protein